MNKPTCEVLDDAVILKGKRHSLPITKEYVLSEFWDLFEGIGKLPGGKYHIQLKPDAQPVQHPPRAVPEKKKAAYKEELERLCSSGIIETVQGHTDWINGVVPVSKPDGSIRLCLDPKDLNKSIKRNQYYTKTIDEVSAELHGGKSWFTLVDARSGFWMVELDNESSLLTTFNTPWGKYKWLRLPFGLKVSADAFQERLNVVLKEVKGITGCIDDILTRGVDSRDHDENLLQLLETARMNVIKLNPRVLQFKTTKCDFFGQTITPEGMKVDDKKIEAIKQMKAPKDKKALQSFQGMVNYLKPTQPSWRDYSNHSRCFGMKGNGPGIFSSRCLRCHQRRALQDPSTRVLWLEKITRYSDWRFRVRIRCRIAARRKTSDLRIQISHSRWGTLFQHREGIARSSVRHVEASQLSVWWTSQSSSRSQTSRNDLEEEYCHCQPETSTTPSEACKIRNSSRVHLWEGQLNCRCPKSSRPSQSKAYGLKADGCDSSASHHFNCSSYRQPTWQNQNCHHCWSSLEPVKALHLSRLAASEAPTPRTTATLLELPWRTCSWRWRDIQSTSTCDFTFW